MAKYSVYYTSYSSSEEATTYSKDRAVFGFYIGGMINIADIGSVFYYIIGVLYLFGEFNYIEYLKSLGLLLVMSVISAYFYMIREKITDMNCKLILLRENAEKNSVGSDERKIFELQIKSECKSYIKICIQLYLMNFLPALLLGTGVIGCVKSIYMLYHKEDGILGLLISIPIIISCILYFILKHKSEHRDSTSKMIKHKKIKINESNRHAKNHQINRKIAFCRKCGSKLYPDSKYCPECGTEIIR